MNWISFIISNIVVVLFFSVCRPGAFQTIISKSKSSTTSSNRSVKQTWYVLLLYSQRYYWRWRFQSMRFIIPVPLMPRTRPIAISGHLQCEESEPLYKPCPIPMPADGCCENRGIFRLQWGVQTHILLIPFRKSLARMNGMP